MNAVPATVLLAALAPHAQLGTVTVAHADDEAHGTAAADAVYTCSMHPDVQSSAPGKCPKCGMKLTLKPALAPDRWTP